MCHAILKKSNINNVTEKEVFWKWNKYWRKNL